MQLTTSSPGEQSPGLDVCIPFRGNPNELWFSIQSIRAALEQSPHPWKFLICWNGFDGTFPCSYISKLADDLQEIGRLKMITTTEALSPPAARQRCVEMGNAEFIFFCDAHVMVPPTYFDRALSQMTARGIDILHGAWIHFSKPCYHYQLIPPALCDFTMSYSPLDTEPYRCAASGHGGFFVRRSTWDKLRYWPLFRGWGGEELSFNIGAWMQGHETWLDPDLIHYHLPSADRGYSRISRAYVANSLIVALVLGGRKQMELDYRALQQKVGSLGLIDRKLLDDVVEYCGDFPAKLQSRFIRSLPEQWEWFKANGVVV